MKYKLLKQIEEKDSIKVWSIFDIWDHRSTLDIAIPECQIPISFLISQWYIEEVKEPKTIYDLKKGDTSYFLDEWGIIKEYKLSINEQFHSSNVTSYFVTEREAKRNKLLRELSTRTDKWLPASEYEWFITWDWEQSSWDWDEFDIMHYHMWLVFRNEEEYNKYLTEEAKDLLFNI